MKYVRYIPTGRVHLMNSYAAMYGVKGGYFVWATEREYSEQCARERA